jgi:hypothetical protein
MKKTLRKGFKAVLLSSALIAGAAEKPNETHDKETKMEHDPLKQISLPIVDISEQTERHVFVACGTDSEWNGHPSTVLLPDGKTIFCVWQARRDGGDGHGAPGGGGWMKRSDDGGQTWSDYLDLPANWREIGRGSPTIHRLVDADDKARLLVFCRDENRATFLVGLSEDDGITWSELRPIGLAQPETGPITGWTPPITILETTAPDGRRRHLMWYERTRDGKPNVGVIWQSASYDGGLTWGESKPVVDKAGASEPACVRSPDGKQLLLLIREDNREMNSLMATSDDEGETWSAPRELPLALTGDRHLARYAPDGRLVIVFRPVAPGGPKDLRAYPHGDFTAWVGRYEDIVTDREGGYLIRLLRGHTGADHTYPGLELLPDGTFVATTYIKYRPGKELHSVVSVRFRLDEYGATGRRGADGETLYNGIILPAEWPPRDQDLASAEPMRVPYLRKPLSVFRKADVMAKQALLPTDWDPKQAGDRVLAGLIRVTAPHVKGAHDAEMALVNDRAYIVAEVNDVKAGESAGWPEIYAALSIVRLDTLAVEAVIPFARSGERFANETLPEGACFVPRILRKDADTLRCFFASEQPGRRQAQTWYRDFDVDTGRFAATIHRARLKTAAGVFDM